MKNTQYFNKYVANESLLDLKEVTSTPAPEEVNVYLPTQQMTETMYKIPSRHYS